jgi:hypothetical protein
MLSVSTSGFAMVNRMASLLDRIQKNVEQNRNKVGSRHVNIFRVDA